MAMMVYATNPDVEIQARELHTLASTLGLQLHVLHVSTDRDIDSMFANLARLRVAALLFGNDAFFYSRREQTAALAERYAVPTIYPWRDAAMAGGLMSYGGDVAGAHREVGVYTGRVLKGDKPADLPVQLSTKVELVINLKTAKALGITFPLPLLGRADEVFE